MRTPRHPTVIVRMRQSRLGKLSRVGPLVGASLVQVNVRCGKPGCHCAEGEGGVRKLAEYLKESLRVWVIPEEAFDTEAARSFQIRLDTS